MAHVVSKSVALEFFFLLSSWRNFYCPADFVGCFFLDGLDFRFSSTLTSSLSIMIHKRSILDIFWWKKEAEQWGFDVQKVLCFGLQSNNQAAGACYSNCHTVWTTANGTAADAMPPRSAEWNCDMFLSWRTWFSVFIHFNQFFVDHDP